MSDNSRILDKIKKLLALAGNNPSAEEAAAAFARAQELASRHRVELAEAMGVTDDRDLGYLEIPSVRLARWKESIATVLGQVNGVWVGKSPGVMVFSGEQGAIDTVQYLYHAITAEIARLCKANAHGRGMQYANSYKRGAASMVCERLKAMDAAATAGASDHALVFLGAQIARGRDHYLESTGLRLRKVKRAALLTDRDAWENGRADGESVNLGGNTAVSAGGRLALGAGKP